MIHDLEAISLLLMLDFEIEVPTDMCDTNADMSPLQLLCNTQRILYWLVL